MSLEDQLETANQMVHQTMMYSADLGNIITFLEQASASHSTDILLGRLHKSVESFGLTSIIKCFDGVHEEVSVGETTSELEEEITKARWEERILTKDEKLFLSWENVSLLILDMPVDDESRYGTLRDSLATLLNGADSRLEQLRTQEAWTSGIDHMYELLGEASEGINKDLYQWRDQIIHIMDDLSLDMTEAISMIDLAPEQEEMVVGMLPEQIKMLKKFCRWGYEIGRIFE